MENYIVASLYSANMSLLKRFREQLRGIEHTTLGAGLWVEIRKAECDNLISQINMGQRKWWVDQTIWIFKTIEKQHRVYWKQDNMYTNKNKYV